MELLIVRTSGILKSAKTRFGRIIIWILKVPKRVVVSQMSGNNVNSLVGNVLLNHNIQGFSFGKY